MKTVNVKNAFNGRKGTYRAYADKEGRVWVYDSIAGHFTTVHGLSLQQINYVVSKSKN